MIAAHAGGVHAHHDLDGAMRIQRAGNHVSEIDDLGDTLRLDIGEHGFEGEIVAVDIGKNGETHRTSHG